VNRILLQYIRSTFRRLAWPMLRTYLTLKHWLLEPYYAGLAVQAHYLYRTSDLFRLRWEALGYQYAEESFHNGEIGFHFVRKAQKEHWYIRFRIFLDATLGRPARPYEMNDDGGHR